MPTNVRDNINKRLIGNWITEIKEGDEKSQGHMSAMWQPGNASVLIRHTILSDEGTVIVTGLLGWNAKKKQLVHSGQSSNGNIFRLDWTTIDDDKWTGQGQGTHEDGDWTSPVSVMLTGNAFHYEDHARDELFTIDAKRS